MLIDWFTVVAQVVNFLILVWLLRRFLYRPILDALDAREKKIAKELADADAKKTEALKERNEFQHKNVEFEQQRAALLDKAVEEAKAERQRLFDEARKAADAMSAKRQESLRNDAHNLNKAIRRRTRQEVFAITRKALNDLATTDLEERLSAVFIRRLQEMNEQARKALGDALKSTTEPALLRSAFELPAAQRTAIQAALNQTFSAEIHVRFDTATDLISGIELSANGQKLAWSIEDYLASLENGVAELLNEQDKAKAQAANTAELATKIGKRAYELYEEQGHKDGQATQNWKKAEEEIRKGYVEPAKQKPASASTTDAKPEASTEPKAEAKIEPKTEANQQSTYTPDAKPDASKPATKDR